MKIKRNKNSIQLKYKERTSLVESIVVCVTGGLTALATDQGKRWPPKAVTHNQPYCMALGQGCMRGKPLSAWDDPEAMAWGQPSGRGRGQGNSQGRKGSERGLTCLGDVIQQHSKESLAQRALRDHSSLGSYN